MSLRIIVTVVELEIAVFTVEVAKTNKVSAVSLAAIVSSPLAFIPVPDTTAPVPAAFELTLHVTELLGLLEPVTEALNCRDLPLSTDWFKGLIATPVTVGIIILTGTLADLEGSTIEVAIT